MRIDRIGLRFELARSTSRSTWGDAMASFESMSSSERAQLMALTMAAA
jgi:hypothetical protein